MEAGEVAVEKICLRCLKFSKSKMDEHPFFEGSLCRECSVRHKNACLKITLVKLIFHIDN